MLQTEEGVVTGVVVRDLIPGTMYTVTVAGVNGAMREDGLGVTSDPVQANTLIGEFQGQIICQSHVVRPYSSPSRSSDPFTRGSAHSC